MMIRKHLLASVVSMALMTASTAEAVCVGCQSVAVANIESERNCSLYSDFWGNWLVIECQKQFPQMRDMIETAIRNTNKFSLSDTARIALKVDENTVAKIINSGGTAYRTALKGIDFLVYGKITEFSHGENSYQGQRFSTSSEDAALAVDLKIVNVRSGKIIFAQNVREELETAGSVGTASGTQSSSMSATRIAGLLLRQAAEAITAELTFSAYPPAVAQVDGDRIYINYGKPFLKQGQVVDLMTLGPPLIDPATGASLGRTETPNGSYRVEQVTATFSVARVENRGNRMPVIGDILRFERGTEQGDEFARGRIPSN